MSEPTLENVKVLLVFARNCETTSDKPGRLFYLVTQEEYEKGECDFSDDKKRVFGSKAIKMAMPGIVYEVEAASPEASSIYSSTASWKGQWPDQEQRLAWVAEDRTYRVYKEAKKKDLKRKAEGDELTKVLTSLREQYRKCPHHHKQALLAAILYEIMR